MSLGVGNVYKHWEENYDNKTVSLDALAGDQELIPGELRIKSQNCHFNKDTH